MRCIFLAMTKEKMMFLSSVTARSGATWQSIGVLARPFVDHHGDVQLTLRVS